MHRRQQRVIIHGVNSQWGIIPAGVPQGATLGPMLLLIYVNDITENINSNIKLFADDTSLYVTVDEDAVNAASQLNDDTITILSYLAFLCVLYRQIQQNIKRYCLLTQKHSSSHRKVGKLA